MLTRSDQQKLRETFGFHRKPQNWDEVGQPIPLKLLEKLPQYDAKELGIESTILRSFTKEVPETLFLVARKGGLYLVNTEGADYARYVRYVGSIIDRAVPDTLAYVKEALRNGGYFPTVNAPPAENADDLLSATFAGINSSGKEMYDITFHSEVDGGVESGRVFVWEENGKKVGDF